ncbi:hypothetical protein [Tropicimonas isoalkanivorans]|uniref:Uncharacterized protein n=1 Tax=Tropicimonas isoalkanivorans TaxID=441112 RepID=A0A1I1P943_9RHOB|nr:hypothetical protein [Tropicimonas isoalkanivorans]SFD06329.1 hypothetical protein SAMN04488094_11468 [Tropicimonas isoalkanivorans]
MSAIASYVGNVAKPLALGLLILTAMGFLTTEPKSGLQTAGRFDCRAFFDDPALNRALCQLNPARYWNTPIGDLVPWLSPASKEPDH